MPEQPDRRYDQKPWTPGVSPEPIAPRWQYLGPFASNEERLTQQAIQSVITPGAEMAAMAQPPLPQINPFPPRFGYDQKVPGILDIIDVSRNYTQSRVTWFSGGVAGYDGTSRNTLGSV